MSTQYNFVEIENVNKIWAIGSIHSNLKSLKLIKNHILSNFEKNDVLIFLGNIIGLGEKAKETLSEVIDLRFNLMAKNFIKPNKIIFLRGAQEEMFLKLMQLQTAPNPSDIINWMFSHGVNKTVESYGFSTNEVKALASNGTLAISKWTSKLNSLVSSIPGHKEYFYNLKHAAFSKTQKILFVNRGVDITRPLSAQNDCFWWGYQNFSKINKPYNSFVRIVRGYQSEKRNNILNVKKQIVCTLFNQPLSNNKILCGIFKANGEVLDIFES